MQEQVALPLPSKVSAEAFHKEAVELVKNAVGGFLSSNPVTHKIGNSKFRKETFESAAWLGVFQAYREYDPEKCNAVTPFVLKKIEWRLRDELNSLMGAIHGSGMKGGSWNNTKEVREWIQGYEREHDRQPTVRELSDRFPSRNRETLKGIITPMADFGEVGECESGEVGPEEASAQSIMAERVMGWLSEHVSDRNREVFLLATYEGVTYEEVGRRFGITKQRVEQLIRHLSAMIRREFGSSLS